MEANIRRFNDLLKRYDDVLGNYLIFESFVIQLSRLNQPDFPTIELMSVLKKEKPLIYDAIKRNSYKNIYLELLTSVECEYVDAKNTLEQLKKIG